MAALTYPSASPSKDGDIREGLPRSGVWESQSEESQAYLQDLADAISALVTKSPASGFDYMESKILLAEEKIALWTRLHSSVRTALKKEHSARNQRNRDDT